MQIIHQAPLAALGLGAAFTVVWGVADPVAAFAEVKVYTGVGKCTMGDLVTPAQAQNYAKEKAMLNAREQAGVYLTSYTRTVKTRLEANEITAIANNITEIVGEVNYTRQPGEVHGEPVIVYTATLKAKVDTDGIKAYLAKDDNEKYNLTRQSEQTQREIKDILSEIEMLGEQYGKAASEQEKERLRNEFAEADRRLLSRQKNDEGVVLLDKDIDGAIQCFRQAIDIDPKNSVPWNNLGYAYKKLGSYDKAIEYYQKAIEVEPGEAATPLANLASVQNHYGNHAKAIEYCQRAISIDSKNLTAWNNMGFAYDALGNKEKAIECYRKAVALNPNYPQIWHNLGFAYSDLEKYQKALECYQKAVELDPNYADSWNNMGLVYSNLGNYAKAIECCRKAIKLDPSPAEPWNNLGIACYQSGRYSEAVEAFKKAVELDPNDMLYWRHLAQAYGELENYEKAVECYRRYLERNPKESTTWNNLGMAYYDMGKYAEALEAFNKALEANPGNETARKNRDAVAKKL